MRATCDVINETTLFWTNLERHFHNGYQIKTVFIFFLHFLNSYHFEVVANIILQVMTEMDMRRKWRILPIFWALHRCFSLNIDGAIAVQNVHWFFNKMTSLIVSSMSINTTIVIKLCTKFDDGHQLEVAISFYREWYRKLIIEAR